MLKLWRLLFYFLQACHPAALAAGTFCSFHPAEPDGFLDPLHFTPQHQLLLRSCSCSLASLHGPTAIRMSKTQNEKKQHSNKSRPIQQKCEYLGDGGGWWYIYTPPIWEGSATKLALWSSGQKIAAHCIMRWRVIQMCQDVLWLGGMPDQG